MLCYIVHSPCVKIHGSTHVAINLLQERCTKSLQSLDFHSHTNLPPQYYSTFFTNFKQLTKLNVNSSTVDDVAYRVIGENCNKLIELDAGGTYISNIGVKYLCLDELMPMMPCLPGVELYR